MHHKLSLTTVTIHQQYTGSLFFFLNLTEQGAAVKSLLRYNSLLCLCHLGLVLSLRSFPHAQERGSPVSEWQASKHVCVLGVLPYEMYTRVNLSGVNGFLNVRESQGMIKERSVIHVLMITTEHAAVLTSLRSLQLVCVCVCAGVVQLQSLLMPA